MVVLSEIREQLLRVYSFNGIDLELFSDQCVEGHTVWGIRQKGDTSGGLIVAHMDEDYNPESVMLIVERLTPSFFVAMQRTGYLGKQVWFYIDAVDYLGFKSIMIMGQNSKAYWNHVLQCMILTVAS